MKCDECGAECAYPEIAAQPFYCHKCGAVLSSHLSETDAVGSASQSPRSNAIRKHLIITIPFIVLILWFSYLWFVSGVLPSVQKYDNGDPKELGYVKRSGLATYRRAGHWVTYHPNGQKASEGEYENGEKVAGTWKYWDAAGQPSNRPVGDTGPE
ncbi:MAG: hypothetical protein H6820_03110 [Phycisphaerales bacterium]|nr:hypothetical protein [Phycisphaerales bacterium]